MITKWLIHWTLVGIRRERIQTLKAMNTGSFIPKMRYIAHKNRLRKLETTERAFEEVLGIID